MAVGVNALVLLGEGAALMVISWATATVLTTIWYERVYLPRIAGED